MKLTGDPGPSAALRKHTEDFSRRTGVTIQFQDHLGNSVVSTDGYGCLYRVAQEGLHNIEKH